MIILPDELIHSIGFDYGLYWMCAGVSKSWHETHKRHVAKAATKIQACYRTYREKHEEFDWFSYIYVYLRYVR
jgi:hypothetical protein